jgi:hypothetical protein
VPLMQDKPALTFQEVHIQSYAGTTEIGSRQLPGGMFYMDLSFLPKAVVRRIGNGDAAQINWNVFLSNLIVICLGCVVLRLGIGFLDTLPHFCLIKETIGIPCPGCGIIRSIFELANFNLAGSFHYNPVGLIIVLSIISQTISRLLLITGFLSQNFINRQTKIVNYLIVTLLMTNWIINLILTLKQ